MLDKYLLKVEKFKVESEKRKGANTLTGGEEETADSERGYGTTRYGE